MSEKASADHHDSSEDVADSVPSLGSALLPLRTPAQAARILSVRESWLRRRAGERRIPCTFLGRHLRFSHADITDIAADGAQPVRTTPHHGARRRGPTGDRIGPESPRRRARRRPRMER